MTANSLPSTTSLAARDSLRVRLPLLISGAILLVLIVFLWFAYREVDATLVRAGGERAQAAADQVAGLFERSGQQGVEQMERAARDPTVRECVRHASGQACDLARTRLRTVLTAGPRVIELWTVTGTQVVNLSVPGEGQGDSQPPLPNGPFPNGPGVSPLQTRDNSLVFADNIADVEEEQPPDDAAAAPPLGRLVSRATFSISPPGALSQLVGPGSLVEIGNAAGGVWTDLSRVVTPPPVNVSRRGVGQYRLPDGERRIGATALIRGTPWAVWVEFPHALIVAPAQSFLTRMLVLAFGVAVLGAVLVSIFTKRITTPLHALSEAASEIAAGHYSRRVSIRRRDEIGRLAAAFNTMTGEIQSVYGALKENHDQTHFALRAAHMGIWQVDLSTGALVWSATMAPLFGLTADRAPRTERESFELVHPQDQASIREAVDEVIRQRAEDRSVNFRVVWPDGSVHWVDSRVRIVDGEGHRPARLLGIAMDVTGRRALEEQLRQANKLEAIGRLAGGVAHDFNNLLTVILGFANLMLEDVPPADRDRHDLREIQKAGERAASLTAQLLAFSRQQILQAVRVDVNVLLTGTSHMLRRLIGEDITLTTKLGSNLAPVLADPGQLEQIVINLAVNARDAMPHGGTLSIETASMELDESYVADHVTVRPGSYVMLAVSDTGVGIDEETKRRMFEPFFTTKERGTGTGLGLATVYGIVKQSNGYIWVYSEPGHGATFKVYLPQADGSAEPARQAIASSPSVGTETLMVVEDEEAVRFLTRVVLERAGYRVADAANADEADARFVEATDLLITDVVMSGSSGPALFQRLSKRKPTLKVLHRRGARPQGASRCEHRVLAEAVQQRRSPAKGARSTRPMTNHTRYALPLVAVLSALPAPNAAAQSLDAAIVGKVTDETGAVLPGVRMTAIDAATQIHRSVTTDPDGRYTLLALPASTYDIRAELSGFAPNTRRAQTLHVGTTLAIDVVLRLASVVERVDVTGSATVLDTTSSTLARIVGSREIDALPVFDRNFNDLAALAPGVTRTGVYGGVDIGGNRDFQNSYQLDGISGERQRLGDQRIALAQDWIQEFRTLTGQFTAEFGQAAGGVVNVITRSGGNDMSGRAYGFFRNDSWDATPAFVTRKPPLAEYRFGGTLGGPVVRERAFFFAGVEHLDNESNSVVNSTFPAANGTFPSTDTRTLGLVKLDVVATPSQRIRLRFNGQRQLMTGSAIGGTSTEEHGRFSRMRGGDVVANWTWIASPTTVNEVRAAWNTSAPVGGCNYATRNPAGTWFERAYPGASFGCPVNFGRIREDQLQLVQNLSWTHGSHDLKAGTQAFWTRSSGDFRNFRDGRYAFERDVPFSPGDPGSYPFSFTSIDGATRWDVTGPSVGAFAQDSWRLTDVLTLNLGVRYDLDGSLTALNPLVRTDRGRRTLEKDLNNVAPRVGVAWVPFRDNRRTLFRGGVGVYYDQNHDNIATTLLLNNILVSRIVSLDANNSQLNPFWPDIAAAKRFLADALSRNTVPDLSVLGSVAGATNDIDHDLRIPATTQASGGMAHELRPGLSASADVVYARGFDLYVIRDVNLDPIALQRINPSYSAIASFGNGGVSRYTALQVQVNAVSSRYLLKAAYTLARNRSNTNSTLSAGRATNPFDYSEDQGPTDNDVRQSVAVNGMVGLPLGLELSGIVSGRSALPYSTTSNAPRPDGRPFGFRPEPRNSRRGDSAVSLDVRLAKTVSLGGRGAVSAFVELFNITNAQNDSGYIGVVTSSRFGEATTADPMRRAQIGFRVDF
ncbi:MAG: HAMP domain-containing protein [Luteitalea sp.]|nr:HAMP domain-containing protein [Luteitalea sp.]